MRGFLTLDPDKATQARLLAVQNRLRDALDRQGVHFHEVRGATLLAWPFATLPDLDEAAELVGRRQTPEIGTGGLEGLPHGERPSEVGFGLSELGSLQDELAALLKETLDPDPPKPAFIRLVRVAPPSRKVGVALGGSGLLGALIGAFVPASMTIWRQTSQGFEIHRTMRLNHGGP